MGKGEIATLAAASLYPVVVAGGIMASGANMNTQTYPDMAILPSYNSAPLVKKIDAPKVDLNSLTDRVQNVGDFGVFPQSFY